MSPTDDAAQASSTTAETERPTEDAGVWTLPNLLCLVRLVGSPVLILAAWCGWVNTFMILMLVLIGTDWIDGRLARWLKQFSSFGAKLDTVADITLFACLLIGGVMLKHEFLLSDWPWIAAVLATYAVSSVVSLWRFRRLPSYHTRIAKLSSYLVIFGTVLVIADVNPWLFRLAMLTASLGNLEAIGITFALPQAQTDVLSLRRALAIRRQPQKGVSPDR